MRKGEALALTWTDLDLERGAVRLDRNKTDDPRAWALDPDVTAALKAYRDNFREGVQPTDLVFVRSDGTSHTATGTGGLPALLRAHLKLIGLDKERPELFVTNAERQRIACTTCAPHS
jgi:integrase